ncbi:hypothetical protein M902_0557 [Bacteriovorax sp. BAL6_X]|uniref:hypothetical protein n=1 Tax=Bacteriovorax sp. BAL6_X TaxID=1201290 RepID=UPI0003867A7C|nr:hypothetical protein [Bacteriovorax sp. BAL6_X]EPZ49802.1 hypothetical protein M902_0557 [Bacteriovorax sp. BAL6_X]
MKRLILPIFLLISSTTFGAVDTGDGSDLSCNWVGAIPSGTYNCTDLTTTGAITITGGNPLIIKVQGDVTIDHTISVAEGIAGGYGPGLGPATLPGSEGSSATNASCGGSSFADIGGSGGAGGSHTTLGSNGGSGVSSGPVDGSDTLSAPGSTSVTYDSALSLESQMLGGAGGGNGGGGCEQGGGTEPGGTPGGSGGGIIHIAAGGDMYINASILANGGAGQPGTTSASGDSGGSGGGAGGIIFLQANGNIELNSALDASGGNGGAAGGVLGRAGGDGGDGIIRLDELDGVITGVGGSYSPSPTIVTLGASGFETLQSGIEPGCAVREDMTPNNESLLGAIVLMILLFGINCLNIKKGKETC